MKAKRILLLTMSVLAITTLGSCRGGRRGRGSTSGADVTSNTDGGQTVIPGGSSQSGGSSQGGTSQGGGSSVTPSSYTMASVAADIGSAMSATLEYDSDYNSYGGAWDMGEDGQTYTDTKAAQSVLKPVVDELATYMPSYLTKSSEHYYTTSEDYWEDSSGDTVYEAIYSVSSVEVSVIGYVYDSALVGQIAVYEVQ